MVENEYARVERRTKENEYGITLLVEYELTVHHIHLVHMQTVPRRVGHFDASSRRVVPTPASLQATISIPSRQAT